MAQLLRIAAVMLLLTGLLALAAGAAAAEEKTEVALKPGAFPPANTGTYLAGELVIIDPMNRRACLRLDGNGPGDRYHAGPLHAFAMLPYGMVRYHGAPAELRDIPPGTHVHGTFYAPPLGDEATIPPLPADEAKFQIKENHALLIEDDFSFYQRQGRSWKVVSLDLEKGKIDVAPLGDAVPNGINEPYTFDIDNVARVWKQRGLIDLDQIAPDQVVQFNLAWSPGWRDKEFTIADLWLDDESRQHATELQRRRHVRFEKQRWLPGWIDAVEHFDYGGGIVTLTLFGGMDPVLYEDLKRTQAEGFGVAAAEKTLRTWFHRADKKIGQVLEWKETENPPPGSSGIQVKLKFAELLEGYRPGNCVRVKSIDWIFVTMPPEERIKSSADQQRSAVFSIP